LRPSIAKSNGLAQACPFFVDNLNVLYQIELLLIVSEFDINLQMEISKVCDAIVTNGMFYVFKKITNN